MQYCYSGISVATTITRTVDSSPCALQEGPGTASRTVGECVPEKGRNVHTGDNFPLISRARWTSSNSPRTPMLNMLPMRSILCCCSRSSAVLKSSRTMVSLLTVSSVVRFREDLDLDARTYVKHLQIIPSGLSLVSWCSYCVREVLRGNIPEGIYAIRQSICGEINQLQHPGVLESYKCSMLTYGMK
jgi:hypothetical protein